MFFKEQGDREKTIRMLDGAETINKMINLAHKGVKPDKGKLPPGLTPAVVLGYDEASRMEKFN